MTDLSNDILIANGFIAISDNITVTDHGDVPEGVAEFVIVEPQSLATILSNLAHYGFVLDRSALTALSELDKDALAELWLSLKPIFAELTKENRKMDDHVVYKNFPREVLQMEEGEYVLRQMMIYSGLPYYAVAEDAEPRSPLGDMKRLKVLTLAGESTPERIFQSLMGLHNRWSDNQSVWADKLIGERNQIDLDDFGFKENGLKLIAKHITSKEIAISTGTDVLRLAAALSDADVSLRDKVKFRSFKRPERRQMLALMDGADNLAEDMATRPEQFKRLLERLRPGDYAFENVKSAQDSLYNKMVKPFSALVDPQSVVPETLDILATRPGEFLRRFHHFYDLFGDEAVDKFLPVMDKLNTRQLVNFRAYLSTINDRETMIYPPKANWARAQVVPNKKGKIAASSLERLDQRIAEILGARLAVLVPEGIALDESTKQIKLQTNDQKLAEYGRGTEFDIPAEMTFARSASYWQNDPSMGTTWFDNGWNFFGEDWKYKGACAWNAAQFSNNAAIFSGDPVNTSDMKGRACQMIDLYFDKLEKAGVRYAVWNVLCYSHKKFSEAKEVLATLQLGEVATKGKLYEPSRAQMVFPLKADAMASFVAYIDLKRRKLVYMDAPLRADVHSADNNGESLSEKMPAYLEYLASLPSMHDLLRDAPEGAMPVLYTDRDTKIESERAFVFRPENAENAFTRMAIADFAGAE